VTAAAPVDPQLVLLKAEAAVERAEDVVGAMEIFLATLALVFLVAGSVVAVLGVREGRRLKQARRDAERTARGIEEIKRGLERSWINFDRLELRLAALEAYLEYQTEQSEEAVALDDLDRMTVIADELNLPQDREQSLERMIRLGRRWKKRAEFARAVRRCERAIEIANSLGAATERQHRLRMQAHLYLAHALIEWAEAERHGRPDTARGSADDRLARAERALTEAAGGVGGEPTVGALLAKGDLALARDGYDEAITLYVTAAEKARDSPDGEERKDGWNARFNASCVLCRKYAQRADADPGALLADLDRALAHLEALPKEGRWQEWAERDPDLKPLRDSPRHSARFRAWAGIARPAA
jgi:tetratricopeptide (TPR) repeat protein